MSKVLKYICILVIFIVVGCVSSYKTIEEVPAKKRPLAEVTYEYMSCSLKKFMGLLEGKPELKADAMEEGLQIIAYKACDTCNAEFDAYTQFIVEKTKDQALADKTAKTLRKQTSDNLVELMINGMEAKIKE